MRFNKEKKRAGIYIRRDVKYTRRKDLEKLDCHVVIVDVFADITMRIKGTSLSCIRR